MPEYDISLVKVPGRGTGPVWDTGIINSLSSLIMKAFIQKDHTKRTQGTGLGKKYPL